MKNEDLYKEAVESINKLFNDKSVSQSWCRDSLIGLKDEIDVLIDTLQPEGEEDEEE